MSEISSTQQHVCSFSGCASASLTIDQIELASSFRDSSIGRRGFAGDVEREHTVASGALAIHGCFAHASRNDAALHDALQLCGRGHRLLLQSFHVHAALGVLAQGACRGGAFEQVEHSLHVNLQEGGCASVLHLVDARTRGGRGDLGSQVAEHAGHQTTQVATARSRVSAALDREGFAGERRGQ